MPDQKRAGCCGGGCCENKTPQVDRRTFLKAGALAAGIGALVPGARAEDTPAPDRTAWIRTLYDAGERRIYRGADRAHIQFPLGGIGAGQVFLDGYGRLSLWQVVNSFSSHAFVEGSHFGLWVRQGDQSVARLLAAETPSGIAGTPDLTFAGEYPYAWVDYGDAASGWPVRVNLEAFSPMIPLEAKDSALPAAVFSFHVENHGMEALELALFMSVPNLVGWDGYAPLEGVQGPDYLYNQNHLEGARLLLGNAGDTDRLGRPLVVLTRNEAIRTALRFSNGVAVRSAVTPREEDAIADQVYWFDDCSPELKDADIDAALKGVASGAAMVITGAAGGLLDLLTRPDRPVASRIFEDFEGKEYGPWTATGDAMGAGPVQEPLPFQNPVSGYGGKGLLNSYRGGDDATGTLQSRSFSIEHDFIHLKVGGGDRGQDAEVRLRVGDAIVQRVTGQNTEALKPVQWDVSPWRGQEARLEIVDQAKGGWGHILVDDVVFSDAPDTPELFRDTLNQLRQAMPFSWEAATAATAPASFRRNARLGTLKADSLSVDRFLKFKGFQLRKGAHALLKTGRGEPIVLLGSYGKGRILVANGAPARWGDGLQRKTVLGTLLGLAADTDYHPQTGWGAESPLHGSMALEAAGGRVSACTQWSDFAGLWAAFSSGGQLESRETAPSEPGSTWNGAVAQSVRLEPGEKKTLRFTLAWHFPNRVRTQQYGWGPEKGAFDYRLGNQYNNWFDSASAVLDYINTAWPRLSESTARYHAALYDTTLPRWMVDAISANTAIVRSPIYVWLEDGSVGGFEGTDACCPMNCTHVYNYAMVMPYLFPALEQRVREMDLLAQMDPDRHFIPHRTVFPMSLPRLGDEIGGPLHHALDGELGTLLKLYREWRHSGDREFLARVWPNACKVMHHVLTDHDIDGSGVLRGEQPNTYDTHLFGSNTFIGTLYLAALRAMESLARIMDDGEFAEECAARYRSGRRGYDKACWNGAYYVNNFDAPNVDPSVYNDGNCYGNGCHADQLLGQWWAHLLDLGHVLPDDHVRKAMHTVFENNWRADLSDHHHNQRVFAEGSEKGLLVCTWPKGGRPENPILYCDEVWTGLEYHVAATLLFEGNVEEALQIVAGARERYTGAQRNPWSEEECGGFYARAMSAWSLLHAAGGYTWDAGTAAMAMVPRLWSGDRFRSFFITGSGWGTADLQRVGKGGTYRIAMSHGATTLRRLTLPLPHPHAKPATSATVRIEGGSAYAVEAKREAFSVEWPAGFRIDPEHPLQIEYLS